MSIFTTVYWLFCMGRLIISDAYLSAFSKFFVVMWAGLLWGVEVFSINFYFFSAISPFPTGFPPSLLLSYQCFCHTIIIVIMFAYIEAKQRKKSVEKGKQTVKGKLTRFFTEPMPMLLIYGKGAKINFYKYPMPYMIRFYHIFFFII